MPRGASPKREHEFEKLKHQFQHEHRYAGREEEVAARIVNKQRSEAGETKTAEKKSTVNSNHTSSARKTSQSASGKSSTSGRRSSKASAGMHAGNPRLSVKEYAGLTIPEVTPRLAHLTLSQIRRLRDYELAHKHRKGMLDKLNRKLVH